MFQPAISKFKENLKFKIENFIRRKLAFNHIQGHSFCMEAGPRCTRISKLKVKLSHLPLLGRFLSASAQHLKTRCIRESL